MIGSTISHYKILLRLGEGGTSQNHLRTFFVNWCDFEDPPKSGAADEAGGVA
jgi:hypothetical protein